MHCVNSHLFLAEYGPGTQRKLCDDDHSALGSSDEAYIASKAIQIGA